jgi:hypothetical protein
MPSQEAGLLDSITGYRHLFHKVAKLEARVLEMDGSASVAMDSVSLFVVVTNNGTSDLLSRVWRLPYGVARVVAVRETACGLRITARVNHMDEDGMVSGADPATIDVCYLGPDHTLLDDAMVTRSTRRMKPAAARTPPN